MQSFKIIKPIHILTPYVRYYWILEDGADVSVSERTLPTGCIQLVFHRGKRLLLVGKKESQPQAFICGQCLNFSDVMSAGKILLWRTYSGGCYSRFGIINIIQKSDRG